MLHFMQRNLMLEEILKLTGVYENVININGFKKHI